jgi:hypothetical protein
MVWFVSHTVPTIFLHCDFDPVLPNYEKLWNLINFDVILHYFIVFYFRICFLHLWFCIRRFRLFSSPWGQLLLVTSSPNFDQPRPGIWAEGAAPPPPPCPILTLSGWMDDCRLLMADFYSCGIDNLTSSAVDYWGCRVVLTGARACV